MAGGRAAYFDAVIPWEKRLARELPLLEETARHAGHRILFPACGTGGHVVALAQRGFDVLGFDIDEDALAIARGKIAAAAQAIAVAGGKARLVLSSMECAGEPGTGFDAAFCLGNALPGISAPGQLLVALGGVAKALRPGAIFLTQNLNYDLRWREKSQFFPVLSGETADEEVLLVKFAEYETEFINFHALFLARPKPGGAWSSHIRSSRQIPLFRDRLLELLSQGGFAGFTCWGDYARTPFDPAKSNDLLVVTQKIS
ncbi:MAG: class I SAM-dependent methyltransferase [Acidobacteriia bacterium]|nr:class I SAM-dependent methyltransferase [Terriglobia bacterium]